MQYDPPTDMQRFSRDQLCARIYTINGQTANETMADIAGDIDRALVADRITAPQARGLRTIYRRIVKAALHARFIREAYGDKEI